MKGGEIMSIVLLYSKSNQLEMQFSSSLHQAPNDVTDSSQPALQLELASLILIILNDGTGFW